MMTLRNRYSAVFVAAVLFVVGLVSALLLLNFSRTTESTRELSVERLEDAQLKQLEREAFTLLSILSDGLINPIFQLDLSAVRNLAQAVRGQKGVEQVHVLDRQFRVIHDATDENVSYGRPHRMSAPVDRSAPKSETLFGSDRLFAAMPVMLAGDLLGWVEIGLSLAEHKASVAALSAELESISRRRTAENLATSLLAAFVFALFGIGAARLLAARLTRPIEELSRGMELIAAGRSDVALATGRNDEIGALARGADDMVGRLRAHAADLKNAYEQLDFAARAGRIGFWSWDLVANTDNRSQGYWTLLGYDRDRFEALVKESFKNLIHVSDRAPYQQAVDSAKHGRRMSIELRAMTGDGGSRWYHLIGQPFTNDAGIVTRIAGALIDIDDRKAAEWEAQQREHEYRYLFDNSIDGLYRVSVDGRMLHVNAALARLNGLESPDELLKRHPSASASWYVEPARQAEFREKLFGEGRVQDFDSEIVRAGDGQRIWISESAWLVRDREGEPLYFEGAVRDISQRKATEDALIQAKQAADAANAAKSRFLSHVSHELRTPLNAIYGFTQVLELDADSRWTAEEKEFLGYISASSEHLLRLVNDLLDMTAIEQGRMKISPAPVSVATAIRESIAVVSPDALTKGVRLEATHDSAEGGLFVLADAVRLRQVLTNLLTNAVLYNRRGGSVSVSVSLPDEATVCIEVSDTGIGIPADQHANVFENLNRLGREGGTIKGAGVGLAICKQLVAMMGGRIGFRSQSGVGSTFRIELPKAHAAPEAAAAAGRPRAGHRAGGRTILYIEDNASAAMLMQGIMRFLDGVQLRHAATGQEGLAISRREAPDVIVLDIGLPDIDGAEVNRQLKRDPRTAGIPVVALSAAAMPDEVARTREIGFFDYVTKPFEVRAFLDTLQAALDASPRRADSHRAATGSE